MCNNPGTPVAFQEGGEVEPIFETVAGREFLVGTPGEYRPGIGDVASALMRAEFASARAAGCGVRCRPRARLRACAAGRRFLSPVP
jgi:hypothetical protein